MSAGIDVIVPCYNYARYLRACTGSVLQETSLPVRVLILDDASSDDTAAEARRIAAEDSRVEVIVHQQNRGHIDTFNEGLGWTAQKYLLLLSADDMVAPGALARAVTLMEANPSVAFVYGKAIQFARNEELPRTVAAGGRDRLISGQDFIKRICARPDNPVETATAVVRTAVQKRVGYYSTKLTHTGDLEMWLRCAAYGDVGEIDALQAFVRMHGENMRQGYAGANFLRDYGQRRDAFEIFFDAQGARVAGAADLRSQALSTLAHDLLWDASRAVEAGRGCSEMIAFAAELWPAVRRSRQYRRLQIKRLVHPLLQIATRGTTATSSFERAAPARD
ncbi:glycosyltransferase family A protein [Phenylobacterium sp. LjRoot219]|uniref:glycosyltransferase family A protein n=1 Tax=Phenylobacterium sp. LjRoot219 TaxID=3342283 RepID=UPI003ED0DCB6